VTEIVGSRVRDAQSKYYRWLVFVAAVYVTVAVAAGVAAATMPSLIRRDTGSQQQSVSLAKQFFVGAGRLYREPYD
jgi:hypothetical protein